MFHRGDLVLDRSNGRYSDLVIWCLVDHIDENFWWARNLGGLDLSGNWAKQFIEQVRLRNYVLKLSPESLSKDKQEYYQEFKTNYLDKDLV